MDITPAISHDNPNVTNVTNVVTNHIYEEKNQINENEIEPERATTPDQSPSTKEKLRKVCTSSTIGIIKIISIETLN